jgi:rod shape determining protein RodA
MGALKDKIDFMTLGATLALLVISLFSMYSATYDAGASEYFQRHALWMFIGILLMASVAVVPLRSVQLLSYPIYGLSILLLVFVLILGKTVAGSKSWFGMGTFGVQPAEIAKLGTLLALASYLWQRHVDLRRFKHIVVALSIIAVPTVLVLAQPDAGTALMFIAIIVPVFYWAGASSFFLLTMIAPAVSAVAALFGATAFVFVVLLTLLTLYILRENRFVSAIVFSLTVLVGFSVQYVHGNLQPYQQKRIDSFLNPESDPLGAGYNVIQSKIAIGSGGVFGKGFLEGTQTQLNFIPAQWTDFIFCVPGEEFGFLGAFVVLSLFTVVLIRGVQVASTVRNTYASVLAIGIVSLFAVHIVINIGMSMGLLPVIGIPLPFLSYGGSHLITNLIMVGLLLNLFFNRKEY